MKTGPIEFIPWDYQEPISHELSEKTNFGVLAGPGSGKTALALLDVYASRERTLIIAPLEILYTTWITEHAKWQFSQNLKINILHGPEKNSRFTKRNVGVDLINPEGLPWLLKQIETKRKFPWKKLIVDESVKFKNHKSKRFKALSRMLPTFKSRRILCANPMPNNYLDLWAQIYILDGGKRLGKSWYSYRNRYFYPTDFRRFNWELKPGAKEEIIERINDIVYFLDNEDIDEYSIPERIELNIDIELTPQLRKQYNDMERKLFAEIDSIETEEDLRILAKSKSSAHIKTWQLANGFIYEQYDTGKRKKDAEGDEVIVYANRIHNTHDLLLDATRNFVEGLQGRPVIIAYYFKGDLEKLRRAFPKAKFTADVESENLKEEIEDAWNDGNISVLITYVGKLSHGLNLQYGPAENILFYSGTYNFDTYDQLIRRLQRQGSTKARIMVHRLVVRDTIHEAIIEKLKHKGDQSYSFLTALKEYRNAKLRLR